MNRPLLPMVLLVVVLLAAGCRPDGSAEAERIADDLEVLGVGAEAPQRGADYIEKIGDDIAPDGGFVVPEDPNATGGDDGPGGD